jgi:hypothetical protein
MILDHRFGGTKFDATITVPYKSLSRWSTFQLYSTQ